MTSRSGQCPGGSSTLAPRRSRTSSLHDGPAAYSPKPAMEMARSSHCAGVDTVRGVNDHPSQGGSPCLHPQEGPLGHGHRRAGPRVLALVASAAGVGYAAAQIGPNDIKNNAITAKKIKKNAVTGQEDQEERRHRQEGQGRHAERGRPGRRGEQTRAGVQQRRRGRLHLQQRQHRHPGRQRGDLPQGPVRRGAPDRPGPRADAAGGDGVCDYSDPGQISDAIAFILPAGYIPAKTQILSSRRRPPDHRRRRGASPHPAVPAAGRGGRQRPRHRRKHSLLDGVSFEAAGSSVVIAKVKAKGRGNGNLLRLGLS